MLVNTNILTTNFKLVLLETDQVSKVLDEIAKKVGETSLNPKQYMFVPVYKHFNNERTDSQILEDAQINGKLHYDVNFIDYKTQLRNLKTNCLELTEKVYVDKPIKRQKEIPIEN